MKLGQNSAYLTHRHNVRIIMEYLLCPNIHLIVAYYAAPKKITENSDFIRLSGRKPNLANILSDFVAYYSRRAKDCHAAAISYQTLDLGMNLRRWCPERHDKAIQEHKEIGQIAMPRHTNSHIHCLQQIRAMSACFGLTQGDLESENEYNAPLLSSVFSIRFFFPIDLLLLYRRLLWRTGDIVKIPITLYHRLILVERDDIFDDIFEKIFTGVFCCTVINYSLANTMYWPAATTRLSSQRNSCNDTM